MALRVSRLSMDEWVDKGWIDLQELWHSSDLEDHPSIQEHPVSPGDLESSDVREKRRRASVGRSDPVHLSFQFPLVISAPTERNPPLRTPHNRVWSFPSVFLTLGNAY
jgi:hypothetical protein